MGSGNRGGGRGGHSLSCLCAASSSAVADTGKGGRSASARSDLGMPAGSLMPNLNLSGRAPGLAPALGTLKKWGVVSAAASVWGVIRGCAGVSPAASSSCAKG